MWAHSKNNPFPQRRTNKGATDMKLSQKLKDQSGQTATEYMLIVAVVVLGAVAGASVLLPRFREGMTTLSDNVKKVLTESSDSATNTITGND